MTERIEVAPAGRSWAVKHREGFLGYATTLEEGARVARELVEWLRGEGRPAELVIGEPRSFSDR